MKARVERFHINIHDSVLEDLRDRLGQARLPSQIDGAGWTYGTDREYLDELLDYWHDHFDWRAVEARLNAYENFLVDIDGLRVHFIHRRSPHEGALPLVITHGWPGSVLEFLKIIDPLADPVAHGGSAEDAFHVVCPSIPGYGFSEAPRRAGFDVKRVAETVAHLMSTLGYERYGAQGGDWGAMVSSYLGRIDSEHCCGIHLNMVPVPRPPDDELSSLSESEMASLEEARKTMREKTGYQAIQSTRPQTLGYALNDSPAGLAAWIVEKFQEWSDCDGDVGRRFTKDELLANITLYWVTETITSSMRLYYESRASGRFGPVAERVWVPTGCAIFPREMYKPPRRWAEAVYNVVHWKEMAAGGHFAAMEEPEALVTDIRDFFRKVRPRAKKRSEGD